MELGKIQVAADEDFEKLWQMVASDNQWKLEYQHEEIKVWSKHSNNSDVKTIKVNITKNCKFIILYYHLVLCDLIPGKDNLP